MNEEIMSDSPKATQLLSRSRYQMYMGSKSSEPSRFHCLLILLYLLNITTFCTFWKLRP